MSRGNECYLFSKVNYNTKVKYKDDTLILPPFARNVRICDVSQLGPLPKGVTKVIKSKSSNTSKDSSKKKNKKKEDK